MPETGVELRAHPVRVVAVEPQTPDAWLVRVEAVPAGHHGTSADAARAIEHEPGQVGILRTPGGDQAYIGFASPPSAAEAPEFLVKRVGPVGEWLVDAVPGAEFTIAGPVGNGFHVDAHSGKDLLFVAMGTAIAPIRSALLHAIERREQFGRIALVYGARSPQQFAFRSEFDRWREADVKIDLTVTQADSEWAGATGRVQHLIEEALRHTLSPVAFVCGSPEMMDETQSTLETHGVAASRVLRNF